MQPTFAPTRMTTAEFEAFVNLSGNAKRRFEWVIGEMIEGISNRKASRMTSLFLARLGNFVLKNKLGEITSINGGYIVGDNRFLPDIGFVTQERLPINSDEQVWFEFAPDLAVEVILPTDKPRHIRLKISAYLAAGTTVWLVDPEAQVVEVYAPAQQPQIFTVNDTISGGTVLAGFSLALKDVFE